MNWRCKFGLHRFTVRDDEYAVWGECEQCGKRAGETSRAAIRRYIERQEALPWELQDEEFRSPAPGAPT